MTVQKLYVAVVTLSNQDNTKLLQQFKSGFKRMISWNEYLSKVKTFARHRYLDYLIVPKHPGANRLFVLSFKNEEGREGHSGYYLLAVKIKDYKLRLTVETFYYQPT